jgi:hypothetical protein
MAYWSTGIALAAVGRRRLNRLIGEATVWDRAGMAREARQALAKAEATLNSYLFSPFSRRTPARQLLAQLARFQLSQSHTESPSDTIVGAYLHHFPQDRDAAIKWLEGVLAGRPVNQQSYDIAAGIGATHVDDMAIQRMLAQFYLGQGCCDFTALNTFRHLMDGQAPLADDLLDGIIDLFISQQRVDALALSVYVTGYQRGRTDPLLVAAIAACRRLVHSTPLTCADVKKAETILAGMAPSQRQAMVSQFLPEIDAEQRPATRRHSRIRWPELRPILDKAWAGIRASGATMVAASTYIGHCAKGALFSKRTRTTLKWMVLGLFGLGAGWLMVSTALQLLEDFKPAEKVPTPISASVSDPFTLQVAAYLSEDDARRYVDQLKKQGLDAYWTRASGNNKTWFQVRISHFKNKAEARSMGDQLKSRNLISDYYVANYKRPDGP